MNDVIRVMRAANFAASKHSDQRRKGDRAEPYLNHLVEVANLAAEATHGDADTVIAALLHDAVEDQGVTNEEIAAHAEIFKRIEYGNYLRARDKIQIERRSL